MLGSFLDLFCRVILLIAEDLSKIFEEKDPDWGFQQFQFLYGLQLLTQKSCRR